VLFDIAMAERQCRSSLVAKTYNGKKVFAVGFIIDKIIRSGVYVEIIVRRCQTLYRIILRSENLHSVISPASGAWIIPEQDCPNIRVIRYYVEKLKELLPTLRTCENNTVFKQKLLSLTIIIYREEDINALRLWSAFALA
jgi:hypothetical protein